MKDIEALLPKEDPKIIEEFNRYVKSREKKVMQYESDLRKKDKELGFKTNLV